MFIALLIFLNLSTTSALLSNNIKSQKSAFQQTSDKIQRDTIVPGEEFSFKLDLRNWKEYLIPKIDATALTAAVAATATTPEVPAIANASKVDATTNKVIARLAEDNNINYALKSQTAPYLTDTVAANNNYFGYASCNNLNGESSWKKIKISTVTPIQPYVPSQICTVLENLFYSSNGISPRHCQNIGNNNFISVIISKFTKVMTCISLDGLSCIKFTNANCNAPNAAPTTAVEYRLDSVNTINHLTHKNKLLPDNTVYFYNDDMYTAERLLKQSLITTKNNDNANPAVENKLTMDNLINRTDLAASGEAIKLADIDNPRNLAFLKYRVKTTPLGMKATSTTYCKIKAILVLKTNNTFTPLQSLGFVFQSTYEKRPAVFNGVRSNVIKSMATMKNELWLYLLSSHGVEQLDTSLPTLAASNNCAMFEGTIRVTLEGY